MCGYCTERAALTHLLEELNNGLFPHDQLLYSVYLQEVSDWRKELTSWQQLDHSRGALVALCRQWSECIGEMSPVPLEGLLYANAFVELQGWLAAKGYPPEWRQAQDIKGTPPNHPSIEQARVTIDAYINGWLRPIPSDSNPWDRTTLNEQFLRVSIAFDVGARFAPDDERLKLLAMLSPCHVPDLNGLDLWLQRRSVHACVARRGVEFIEEYVNNIRFEAILSVVLSELLTQRELLNLQALLQVSSQESFNFVVDEILEAIRQKLLYLATELSSLCTRSISGPYQFNQRSMFRRLFMGAMD